MYPIQRYVTPKYAIDSIREEIERILSARHSKGQLRLGLLTFPISIGGITWPGGRPAKHEIAAASCLTSARHAVVLHPRYVAALHVAYKIDLEYIQAEYLPMMLSIACDMSLDRILGTLIDRELLDTVATMMIGADEELLACLPFLERCLSMRNLELVNPRASSLQDPIPPSHALTRLQCLTVSFGFDPLPPYADFIVLLRMLPLLKT